MKIAFPETEYSSEYLTYKQLLITMIYKLIYTLGHGSYTELISKIQIEWYLANSRDCCRRSKTVRKWQKKKKEEKQ